MGGFYTTHEAARILGVSLPTVVNWIKARRLKAHRTPGGHRRIARAELAGFMLKQGIPLPEELEHAVEERRKALVVGEPGPAREGLLRQLAQAGLAVEQASPGFAAGIAVARFVPDVVVLHVGAPDGGDTLLGLRSDRETAAIPVLGIGAADSLERLTRAGCAAVLQRPLADGALAQAITALLAPPPRRRGATPAGG
jgi:excisionase family DNA binding protein